LLWYIVLESKASKTPELLISEPSKQTKEEIKEEIKVGHEELEGRVSNKDWDLQKSNG